MYNEVKDLEEAEVGNSAKVEECYCTCTCTSG